MFEKNKEEEVVDRAEVAEQKVVEAVDKIETSKMGRSLPTEVHNIQIGDIVKMLLLSNFANFMPLYIIFTRDVSSYVNWIRKLLNFIFIVSFIWNVTLGFFGYVSGAKELYKFLLAGTIVKGATSLIIMIMCTIGQGFSSIAIGFIFVLYVSFLDLLFLYYLALYFKRLDSDEYDQYGVKIITKQEKV